ncbi:phosphate acyltransferase PlsX [Tengunoibacter tsumagoiensis]|uniref:Phosphate acyltransferase n=1 Tax=Tengunoibacter tsumagoiensis TaxID=2014871 RepID=A0A401ZTW3_9CHLR|nr:phosphate acyltransferase PlsX [Tengunoibacter tsumagoiensis]GCE10297.1 phosphate acyltransferase [Tengunoibacter tsumagoiensis]
MSASVTAPVRVALDVMGGDNAPAETVSGAVQAAREYGMGVYLVGREEVIRAELAKHDTTGLDLPIIHTDEVIEMDEHPANAVRRKKNASMILALQQVRDGAALGAVSAGNSGAMMAASLFTLKRIPGVDRPALGGIFPTKEGACLVIDMGANTDCKPEYLQQFALMGSIYMERIFKISSPRIGLLANGEEESKGNQQVIDAHHLLKASAGTLGLNFVGNVEGRDIPTGEVNVVVCDGFVGNVVLKLSEGLAETLLGLIREQMTSTFVNKLAAAVLRPSLRKVFKRLDYAEYGGVPLLGVNGSAIISHGRSNAKAIKNALRVARQTAETGVAGAIAEGLSKLNSPEEVEKQQQAQSHSN